MGQIQSLPASLLNSQKCKSTSLDEDDGLCLKSNFCPNEAMRNLDVWMAVSHIMHLKKGFRTQKKASMHRQWHPLLCLPSHSSHSCVQIKKDRVRQQGASQPQEGKDGHFDTLSFSSFCCCMSHQR